MIISVGKIILFGPILVIVIFMFLGIVLKIGTHLRILLKTKVTKKNVK